MCITYRIATECIEILPTERLSMLFILIVGSRHKTERYLSTGAKRKAVAAPPTSAYQIRQE
jgi:hypothetical protein